MPRFKIPVHIPIAYVPKGRRSIQYVYDRGEAEVEFRDVSVGRTELVARLGNRPYEGHRSCPRRTEVKDGDPLLELRWFEGRYWLSSGPAKDVQDLLMKGSPADNTPFENVRHWQTSLEGKEPFDERAFLRKAGPLRVYERKTDKVHADIVARSERIIVIDGVMFEQVAEPHFRAVDSYRGYYNIQLGGLRKSETDGISSGELPIFAERERLDSLDRLLTSLANAGAEAKVRCNVEVLRPDLLFRCPLRDAALRGTDSVLSQLMHRGRWLHVEAAEAMYQLRDAMEKTPQHVSPPVKAALRRIANLGDADPAWVMMVSGLVAQKAAKVHRHSTPEEEAYVTEAPKLLASARALAADVITALEIESPNAVWDDTLEVACVEHDAKLRSHVVSSRQGLYEAAMSVGLDPVDLARRVSAGATVIVLQRNDTMVFNYPGTIHAVGIAEAGSLIVHAVPGGSLDDYVDARALLSQVPSIEPAQAPALEF